MEKWFRNVVLLVIFAVALVSLAGQSTAQTAPPPGADRTKITDWTDPRPAAWATKYPLFAPVKTGDGSLKRLQDAGTLRICGSSDTVGLFSIDTKTKQYVGIEVDIANALSPTLGIAKVQWVDVPWQSLIPSLQANKCDLISDGLAIRSDRAKAPGVRFTTPYFLIYDLLVVKKDSSVRGLEDLKGRKICGVTGSTDFLTLQAVLQDKGINATTSTFDGTAECFLAVSNGTVDAGWTSQDTLPIGLKQFPNLKVVGSPQRYVPSGKFSAEVAENPYFFGSFGGVTHASDNDLNLAWSVGLRQLAKNGTLEQIYKKYDLWSPEVLNLVKPNT